MSIFHILWGSVFSQKSTCKKIEFLYTLGRNMNETTETTHLEAEVAPAHVGATPEHETTTHATTEHAGPHIPSPR